MKDVCFWVFVMWIDKTLKWFKSVLLWLCTRHDPSRNADLGSVLPCRLHGQEGPYTRSAHLLFRHYEYGPWSWVIWPLTWFDPHISQQLQDWSCGNNMCSRTDWRGSWRRKLFGLLPRGAGGKNVYPVHWLWSYTVNNFLQSIPYVHCSIALCCVCVCVSLRTAEPVSFLSELLDVRER